ncbi:flagellar biosynthesis anti-sigma factor FlgM [Conexibacter stalactiti]|uniref:Flagellar biosynthesis anti-sigma factor FlgM n=1 Tax=Conexibacter stalactiti TaxID=1940611 RepID=A0ABU4HS80_9ACTN|nr:flagellar biosynthesis anti-sigma factor FlgM [Conexibacter stalactiti]MDW5595537.1 flagellar biosynthesis anti-sigma factor FlgM [Conexibacter stalactiti]MEC5036179.1 flagellar biosynthesis anti-sigma factor FlgM [Conexibacter stalactiti]
MVATQDRLHRITVARRDRITRASRLRLLARQIANGEYQVDADKLAEVLVERAQFHRQVRGDLLVRTTAGL